MGSGLTPRVSGRWRRRDGGHHRYGRICDGLEALALFQRGNFGAPGLDHTDLVAGAGHTVLVAAPVGIAAGVEHMGLLEAGLGKGCIALEVTVGFDDMGIEGRGQYWLGQLALALGSSRPGGHPPVLERTRWGWLRRSLGTPTSAGRD